MERYLNAIYLPSKTKLFEQSQNETNRRNSTKHTKAILTIFFLNWKSAHANQLISNNSACPRTFRKIICIQAIDIPYYYSPICYTHAHHIYSYVSFNRMINISISSNIKNQGNMRTTLFVSIQKMNEPYQNISIFLFSKESTFSPSSTISLISSFILYAILFRISFFHTVYMFVIYFPLVF